MLKRIWHGRLPGLRLFILLAVVALLIIGQVAIRAADTSGFYAKRQLPFIALGVVALALVSLPPYSWFGKAAFPLYFGSLGLLLFVLIGKELQLTSVVPVISGATRWITAPGIRAARIQPSEIAKLVTILALAWQLRGGEQHRTWKGLIKPFLITLAPIALILLQPDLGTALLFLPVLLTMLFVAGARWRHLLLIVAAGILISPVMYFSLKGYQKERIQVLLRQGETEDVYWMRGPGYQLNQSKICIGSGQTWGQGWGQGPFVRYNRFLPEKHNDFIFALIANQAGFVGCIMVIGLYAVILVSGLEIAAQQPDRFGRLVAAGIMGLIITQTFINVGVTVGLMPVTGMTLPFVSYGGSSMLSGFLALGLLFNVARHRRRHLRRDPLEDKKESLSVKQTLMK